MLHEDWHLLIQKSTKILIRCLTFGKPPDESPINIQQLISFQKSLTMTPQNIRESIRPLSWTAQMKKVIDELDIRPQHTILEK